MKKWCRISIDVYVKWSVFFDNEERRF